MDIKNQDILKKIILLLDKKEQLRFASTCIYLNKIINSLLFEPVFSVDLPNDKVPLYLANFGLFNNNWNKLKQESKVGRCLYSNPEHLLNDAKLATGYFKSFFTLNSLRMTKGFQQLGAGIYSIQAGLPEDRIESYTSASGHCIKREGQSHKSM